MDRKCHSLVGALPSAMGYTPSTNQNQKKSIIKKALGFSVRPYFSGHPQVTQALQYKRYCPFGRDRDFGTKYLGYEADFCYASS